MKFEGKRDLLKGLQARVFQLEMQMKKVADALANNFEVVHNISIMAQVLQDKGYFTQEDLNIKADQVKAAAKIREEEQKKADVKKADVKKADVKKTEEAKK